MSSQKATIIATNYIQFSSFLWAFTWYHSWKEVYGSKSYIFKNLRNYFLKLVCLFRKHNHCEVGKIYQFLTINQLKIQITENFKSLPLPVLWRHLSRSVNKGLWNQSKVPSIQQNWNLEEELYYFAAKKQVGGLGTFGSVLKKRYILLFKCGTMQKPIKN